MRAYFLPLLLLVACEPGKDEGDTDTGVELDTAGIDTADTDTADTDTADTDTADTADTDTADTGPDIEPATPPEGEALYIGTCAPCHGEDGRGTGDYPDITGELDRTDSELIGIMIEGKDEMPPQPLSEDQAQAVVDYMRATF